MDGQNYSGVSAESALQQLGSSKQGLSLAEAAKRLKKYGPHTLQHPEQLWIHATFRRNLQDAFFWILIVTELASLYLRNTYLMLALGIALLINISANAAFVRRGRHFLLHLDRLLQAPAMVTRSGKRLEIGTGELVLGDIVHFAQGETVPADMRLLDADHLVTDEANIMGGHKHISKAARIGTQNLALFGSRIVAGSGRGVVIALGTHTVLGYKVNTVEKTLSYLASRTDKQLAVTRKRTGQTAVGLFIILTVFALASRLTLHDFASDTVLLAAALVPISLAPVLALLPRQDSAPRAWLFHGARTQVAAKVALVIIGIIVQYAFNVPVAITAVQLVVLDLILLLPTLALGADEPRLLPGGKPFGFSFLLGALAYCNFLFFFWRIGIGGVYLSSQSTLYFRAATLTFLTIVLCQFVSLKMIRSDNQKQFFTRYLWSNPKLFAGFAVALFLVICSVYLPSAHSYVGTQNLTLPDWLTAIAAAAIYFSICLLQRHTRLHSRKAILELQKIYTSAK